MSLLIVALDLPSGPEASTMASRLVDDVDGFKVGLELLLGEGPKVVEGVAALGKPVFVDAKLHDIPHQVGRAARRLAGTGARWVTAHAAGGSRMLEAAVDGLGEDGAGVLAVTVLTSLDSRALAATGVPGRVEDQVSRLAQLAMSAGVEGLVCSVAEAPELKARHAEAVVATPGIRVDPDPGDDQARVATPEAAVAAGADLLVVGRPITRSSDPGAAARGVKERMAAPPR